MYTTYTRSRAYLQRHVRVQFELRDDVRPGQEFLGLGVDEIIEHGALRRIFYRLEFGHPPFGKFHFEVHDLYDVGAIKIITMCKSCKGREYIFRVRMGNIVNRYNFLFTVYITCR